MTVVGPSKQRNNYDVSEATVATPLIVADNFVMACMFVVLLSISASAWPQTLPASVFGRR